MKYTRKNREYLEKYQSVTCILRRAKPNDSIPGLLRYVSEWLEIIFLPHFLSSFDTRMRVYRIQQWLIAHPILDCIDIGSHMNQTGFPVTVFAPRPGSATFRGRLIDSDEKEPLAVFELPTLLVDHCQSSRSDRDGYFYCTGFACFFIPEADGLPVKPEGHVVHHPI